MYHNICSNLCQQMMFKMFISMFLGLKILTEWCSSPCLNRLKLMKTVSVTAKTGHNFREKYAKILPWHCKLILHGRYEVMSGMGIVYYQNYSPVGDLTVFAICFVFIILIRSSYVSRTKNFLLFCGMIGLLMIAALTGVGFHVALKSIGKIQDGVVYFLRIAQHLALFGTLLLYVSYIMVPLHLDKKKDRRYIVTAGIGYIGIALYEILGTAFRIGFYIDGKEAVHEGFNIFPFGYLFFIGIILFLLFRYRNRMFKQIIYGILGTCGISFLILFMQGRHGQTSFTTVTFLFPVIALFYMIHANPYDIDIGAVNETAFDDTIAYHYLHKQPLLIMSLFMHDFEGVGKKYPRQFQNAIRRFSGQYFHGAVLFQISNGHMILAVDIKKNQDYKDKIEMMLQHFADEYAKFRMDYKIVIMTTEEDISRENDYVKLIRFVGKKMNENEIHYVGEKDIEEYKRQKYILKELKDIYEKCNLEDERVKVYCQPVYNIDYEKYDTAEALMRMVLPEIGMVFPDQFIPLAEQYGYIHTLSKIILHKTCRMIHNLLEDGYDVNRISVNISAVEVREEDFCKDIIEIVGKSGIPFDKIAIELTESQNESDFMIVREKIKELRSSGIKFYLDDFGTGYSNFERIMELPFDIIKFDRSMVLASAADQKSEKMVSSLASMFDDMDYAVLYEGVENAEDEEKCVKMRAKYLQGYKYSKPIPIEKLTEYFEKSA